MVLYNWSLLLPLSVSLSLHCVVNAFSWIILYSSGWGCCTGSHFWNHTCQVLKARLFAYLLSLQFGVSEHVELLAIKCQHPSPFILISPCVLRSFPVAGLSYMLGLKKKKKKPLEREVRFVFRRPCEVHWCKNFVLTWLNKPSSLRKSLIEQLQTHSAWKHPQKSQAATFLL